MLSEIEKRLSVGQRGLIRKADILKVAELRNMAIHHGIPPSEEAVEECHGCARHFLCEASRNFFGLDFLSLTMIDFIQSEKAKKLLRLAEANLEAKSYFHSRVPAKLALQLYLENYIALMPYGSRFKHYSVECTIQFAKKNEPNDSERAIAYSLNELHRAVSDEIEETRALLGMAALGYSLERLKKYDSIASRISFRIGAVSIPSETGTRNTSSEIELSKWFIAFIIELILQMEQSGVSGEPIDQLIKWYDLVIEKEGKVFS